MQRRQSLELDMASLSLKNIDSDNGVIPEAPNYRQYWFIFNWTLRRITREASWDPDHRNWLFSSVSVGICATIHLCW